MHMLIGIKQFLRKFACSQSDSLAAATARDNSHRTEGKYFEMKELYCADSHLARIILARVFRARSFTVDFITFLRNMICLAVFLITLIYELFENPNPSINRIDAMAQEKLYTFLYS